MKDELFKEEILKQFEFDEKVASVFDDMLKRSVPFYEEALELSCSLAMMALKNGCEGKREKGGKIEKSVLDLGSSTGNFLISLAQILKRSNLSASLRGIDSAPAMIEKSAKKAGERGLHIDFECQDFLSSDFGNNTIISAHYTLQFIRPMKREALLRKIYESLESGGIFIMSEKMNSESRTLDFWLIDLYERYKLSRGYSQSEINSKRARLQNVLVTFSLSENMQMLKNAGFREIEVVLCYLNFATLVAYKK